MMLEQVKLTLLEIDHLEGTAQKSGKPYSFYKLILGDDEFNRLPANIGRSLLIDGIVPDWMFKAAESKADVICSITVEPDGFGCKLTVTEIEEA